MADDAALIAAARAGNQRAFAELIDQHQRALRAFLRRVCRNPNDVDDIAQETLIAAWTQLWRYRGSASVGTWLCAIAWRKARDADRSTQRRMARDATAIPVEITTPRNEDAIAIRQALATLPIDQRAALALCLGGEFTHAEAAEILGLPLGTVHSHIARGRTLLLEKLREMP